MKKIFFIILIIFMATPVFAKETDYKKIYDNLENADFSYMFNTDPYQNEDYTRFHLSPYPLLRTGVEFRFKNTVIPRGYYLLTPREKNGKDYVLFKQNGKVVFIIPVYEKSAVLPTFYDKYIPKQKKTAWRRFCEWNSRWVGKVSKDSKKAEPPKAYIDVNDIGGEFFEVVLYYGADKYKMLFLRN